MPLLPSQSSAKLPSRPTFLAPTTATQASFDDASIKPAQSSWTSGATILSPNLSEQQIRAELSDPTRVNPELERKRQRWIQVKNRRRRWLEMHPQYFRGSELESADPLLYDRLVRRFQSASEREAEGKNKGFAATMEASIRRGEARIEEARIRQEQGLEARHPLDATPGELRVNNEERDCKDLERANEVGNQEDSQGDQANGNGRIAEDSDDPWTSMIPDSREGALRQWREAMSLRFLEGKDNDFDYATLDNDSEWDDHEEEERRRMEDWFDDEEPSWGTPGSEDEQVEKVLNGETGIQDY